MKIEKLNAIVLALSPALGVYSIFSGVGLQDLCWLILLPLILLSFKENITKDISLKFYACILLLTLLNSSYSYTDISLSIHNLFPISICFGVLILVKKTHKCKYIWENTIGCRLFGFHNLYLSTYTIDYYRIL